MSKSAEHPTPASHSLAGTFRRFGEYGVVYEVLKIESDDAATIRVVASGETLSCPLRKIHEDPDPDVGR